ncbi:MAG: DUF1801 domain-containing protein [Saprospiraceae bacterium]|nr:DUF1801 domain-containing protein [Saprospiraceae bacterium]MCF8248471.1 DUF1801 domain-containing protein [Saprospiraceae bacterium]MCF8281803.1 DUF1801 domain-containing protein [Bacteroidales bacterium]MCF8310205.1 DUF1801 domain-containing protein [Saprospiraceae bacterium]MCF8439356.1 DUF1801 domain-containing protein [Saprospiraceae bacterium]
MEKKKKQIQNVSFKSIRDLLIFLPEDQLLLVAQLRELIVGTIPNIQEKLSFNVPFYRLHKGICYIWPGAVSWGSKTWEGVEFGFNYGNLLADEANYLERGTRKQVFNKRFLLPEEINEELLRAYLLEAAEIDEIMFREKMMNTRKRKG